MELKRKQNQVAAKWKRNILGQQTIQPENLTVFAFRRLKDISNHRYIYIYIYVGQIQQRGPKSAQKCSFDSGTGSPDEVIIKPCRGSRWRNRRTQKKNSSSFAFFNTTRTGTHAHTYRPNPCCCTSDKRVWRHRAVCRRPPLSPDRSIARGEQDPGRWTVPEQETHHAG